MALITGSVGRGGKNKASDVRVVQRLLNRQRHPPKRKLTVDGKSGRKTIAAIRQFQSAVLRMRSPDGRVDPGGRTIRRLNKGTDGSSPSSNGRSSGGTANLSGGKWWRTNQKRFPNSTSLEDLKGSFKENVKDFVRALRRAGAKVRISSTKRDKIRAHLMHFCWRIAREGFDPKNVPGKAGLDIQWDHGNLASSKKAAREMVALFRMAFRASRTSNHIRGLAIDMTITWQGVLKISAPGSNRPTVIETRPRNGAGNRELHQVGEKFGVKKHRTDPPHWSHSGR